MGLTQVNVVKDESSGRAMVEVVAQPVDVDGFARRGNIEEHVPHRDASVLLEERLTEPEIELLSRVETLPLRHLHSL
jgi:hypothetical protein